MYSSTHTCKGHTKDMKRETWKGPEWAVTHMHSQATEFQSVCGYRLWENEGGLSLEAGAGDHPQQSPTSLIRSVHKPALEPRGQAAFLHYHASICGGQISLGLGRQDTLYAQGLAPNIRWLLVLCQVQGRYSKPHHVCSGPSCTAERWQRAGCV